MCLRRAFELTVHLLFAVGNWRWSRRAHPSVYEVRSTCFVARLQASEALERDTSRYHAHAREASSLSVSFGRNEKKRTSERVPRGSPPSCSLPRGMSELSFLPLPPRCLLGNTDPNRRGISIYTIRCIDDLVRLSIPLPCEERRSASAKVQPRASEMSLHLQSPRYPLPLLMRSRSPLLPR